MTSNDLTRSSAVEEATPIAAIRKHGGVKQREVDDWGVMSLKEFVKSRLARRAARVGAKKKRRARRVAESLSSRGHRQHPHNLAREHLRAHRRYLRNSDKAEA